MTALDRIVEQQRAAIDDYKALTAPGGWRMPTTYVYTFSGVPHDVVDMLLPGLTMTRGGIRWTNGPVRHYRWRARTRRGWWVKRVLFGVQWTEG